MTGTQSSSIIAMKIFIEKNQVTPVWVFLERFRAAIHRPLTRTVSQENVDQSVRQLGGYFPQGHLVAGPCGTLHRKAISQIPMKLLEGLNQQKVDWEPGWPAPVGISAKIACSGLRRGVIQPVLLSV